LKAVSGNLDQEIRHPAILEVLKTLNREGATLLTINYDDLLEKYCNLHHIGRSGRSNQDEVFIAPNHASGTQSCYVGQESRHSWLRSFCGIDKAPIHP
jgi:hypothetical protein